MTLLEAEVGKEYIIEDIITHDDELDNFLFTLGCYSGEPITIISRKRKTMPNFKCVKMKKIR